MQAQRSSSGSKRGQNLVPYQWVPGQSGNPKGRERGTRNKLSEDFVADLHESWKVLGKPAIMTVAWTDPSTYLKVIASLVPKDIEVTVTNVHLERMSTSELEAALRETREAIRNQLEATEGEDKVFTVD